MRRAGSFARLRQILQSEFPAGTLTVRYETWIWIATTSP